MAFPWINKIKSNWSQIVLYKSYAELKDKNKSSTIGHACNIERIGPFNLTPDLNLAHAHKYFRMDKATWLHRIQWLRIWFRLVVGISATISLMHRQNWKALVSIVFRRIIGNGELGSKLWIETNRRKTTTLGYARNISFKAGTETIQKTKTTPQPCFHINRRLLTKKRWQRRLERKVCKVFSKI